MAKDTIRIKLVRSPNGKAPGQRRTVKGLGLKKPNQVVERENTREIRGMIRKVIHLVEVEE